MVWGPEIFEALRSISSPALDRIVRLLTDLGSTEFFITAVPIVYWCLNKTLGLSLGIVTVISGGINIALKDVFQIPRPYVLYPHLGAPDFLLTTGTGWSFPSGHAQTTATFWGYLALHARRRWAAWLAASLIAIVGFTRVYATVHSPTDVLVGGALGLVVAAAYLLVDGFFSNRKTVSAPWAITASIAIPSGLLAAASLRPGLADGLANILGFLAGAFIGRHIERTRVRFQEAAPFAVQVYKVLVGLAGVMALRYGLKAVFPAGPVFHMLRYLIIALWVTAGAPWLFASQFPVSRKRQPRARRWRA